MIQMLAMLATLWVVECHLSPMVHVEHGALFGDNRISAGGRPYFAFEGVRYARAPLGKRRFKEAVPPKPWIGVWNASTLGSECLQYTHKFHEYEPLLTGDEDCLFVNVYTPKVPEGDAPLLDVIVYIHGGAFMYGSGNLYGPKYLMDREVVYVTFNYRLGILGFLSTEDEVVPGNNGLKDQTMALKWIQRNVAVFGGNPNSVTITGTSAGGASVHYHYLSPQSRGLFKQGIATSGSALEPWTLTERARDKANKLGALVGCGTKNSMDLVQCLRGRPAQQLVRNTEAFMPFHYTPFTPFGPVVEKVGSTAFLPKSPVDIITNGEAQDLPMIASVTTEEGLYPVSEFLASDELLNDLDLRFSEIAPLLLDFNDTIPQEQLKDASIRIRQFYFGTKPINRSTAKELIQMIGDRLFVIEVERAARLHAAVYKSPVYFYRFSYRGKHSWSNLAGGFDTNFGVSHGDDTAYTLDASYYLNPTETQSDRDMVEAMLDMWTSYAKTGVPKLANGLTWEPVIPDATELRYLHIANSSQQQMKYSRDLGNRKFWNSLPISESQIIRGKIRDEL